MMIISKIMFHISWRELSFHFCVNKPQLIKKQQVTMLELYFKIVKTCRVKVCAL